MRRHRLIERLRAYLIAGLLVTGPICLTLWLLWVFVSWTDGLVGQLVPRGYDPATYLPFRIPGLGLVVVAAGLILIGWGTAGVLGRFFVRVYERVLDRLPVIRGLYGATKQIFQTVLSQQSNTFREVALVQWPRKGMWTIGFITGKTEGEIRELVGEDVVNIYVPTTPNPTSGYLMFIPRRDIVILDMTIEEAIKFVISGGIVAPPDRRKLESAPAPEALEEVAPRQ
jgi:uncharacterized membrane protein